MFGILIQRLQPTYNLLCHISISLNGDSNYISLVLKASALTIKQRPTPTSLHTCPVLMGRCFFHPHFSSLFLLISFLSFFCFFLDASQKCDLQATSTDHWIVKRTIFLTLRKNTFFICLQNCLFRNKWGYLIWLKKRWLNLTCKHDQNKVPKTEMWPKNSKDC